MIAIKDMEMPNACLECDLCVDYGSYGMCKCNDFEVDTTKFSRHKDCPLVEIVTCKDCKHFERLTCLGGQCLCPTNTYINETTNDFYCKDGERRK